MCKSKNFVTNSLISTSIPINGCLKKEIIDIYELLEDETAIQKENNTRIDSILYALNPICKTLKKD